MTIVMGWIRGLTRNYLNKTDSILITYVLSPFVASSMSLLSPVNHEIDISRGDGKSVARAHAQADHLENICGCSLFMRDSGLKGLLFG